MDPLLGEYVSSSFLVLFLVIFMVMVVASGGLQYFLELHSQLRNVQNFKPLDPLRVQSLASSNGFARGWADVLFSR